MQYLDVTLVVTTDGSIFNTILLFLQLLLQLSYHLEVLSLQYYFLTVVVTVVWIADGSIVINIILFLIVLLLFMC